MRAFFGRLKEGEGKEAGITGEDVPFEQVVISLQLQKFNLIS